MLLKYRNKVNLKKGVIFFSAFIFSFFLDVNYIYGQSDCGRATIIDAKKDYNLGSFENTLSVLNTCLITDGFTNEYKEDAYKILAWTYLAIDSVQDARNAIIELLNLNPSYSIRTEDPISFRNMVTDIKLGSFDLQVTSVSKKPENIKETPATVMVITANDIRQRGYIDLEAMFSDLPGFDVSRTLGTSYSNIYQRGYRSNNTDRTMFMIDGVEENALFTNVAFLSRQYPISNVKRVEIVYGPASTMYGANAFLGVINVITKEADELLVGKSYSVSGEVSAGNYETRYGELTFATKNKNISFTTTGRYFSSNEIDLSGYKEFDYNPQDFDTIDYASILGVANPDASFLNSPYYEVKNDSAQLTTMGIDAARNFDKAALTNSGPGGTPIKFSNISDHYLVNSKLRIGNFLVNYLFWNTKSSSANYGNDNNRAGPDYGGIWSPAQSFLNTNYTRDLSDKLSITNIAQYRVSETTDISRTVIINNYSNGSLGPSDLINDLNPFWKTTYFYHTSKQFRNEFKVNYKPFRGLDIVSGIEIRNSTIQGNFLNLSVIGIVPDIDTVSVIEAGSSTFDTIGGGNAFAIYDYGVYFQGTYNYNSWVKMTLGGRFDYNKVRSSGGYGNIFNPRVALVLTPGKSVIKFIFAEAFKDATNFQKYATAPTRLFNNPNLAPEKVTNFETSLGYRFNKRLYVDASMYYSLYSGSVTTKKVTINGVTSFRNENEGSLKIFGIQANASYNVSNYSIYGNYSFVNPKVEELNSDGVGTETFIRIGDISTHRINAGINALYFEKLNINLRANFSSRRPVGPGTSVSENTLGDFPSLFLLSGAVTYKKFIPGLTLQLSVNNILNHEYSDPGIRSADGTARPYRTPQRGIFGLFKLIYEL